MRIYFVLVLLIITANTIFSQDLIVTTGGDSINCKITNVKAENIYFTFKHKDEIRSTLLPISEVKTHKFNYYKTSEVSKEKIIMHDKYQHFRFAINGGYSYLTATVSENVPSDFKDYIKALKSGYHFGGDLIYYFTEPLGIGAKYYLFKSSNSLDNIYTEDAYGNRTYGKMSDDISISFIGPTFSTRLINQNKTGVFLTNISLGYISYSNNKVIIDKYKMTGGTMGLALDAGYDFQLSEEISLGFQISCLSGTLFQYKWNDGITNEFIKLENGEYESLNRIDFSIGLRFNK